MSSSRKKVILRRTHGDLLFGYLPVSGFVRNRSLDLLDLGGRVIPILLNDVKLVSFVRDFNLNDTVNPERLTRRTFLARPRTEGLFLTPPDIRSNTQRIYVPRTSIAELQLIAVITSPSKKKPTSPTLPSLQEDLFNADLPPNARPN
jgi:hypothetical protein